MQKTFNDCIIGDIIYSVSFSYNTLDKWEIINIDDKENYLKMELKKLYNDVNSFRNFYSESKTLYFEKQVSFKKISDDMNDESYWCVNKDSLKERYKYWVNNRRNIEKMFNKLIESV